MEFKKVELYNFSSYAGKAAFDLSTEKNKNIILIGGNNGAGKTSLFTAIKLALYGPLCFHYQGKNAQYSARIKELMNHDVFMEQNVCSYVEVQLTIPQRQTYHTYTVHREWGYSGQKVQENYWVKDENGLLAPRDRDYFQNYLFTILPPNMFEFFFFDGEEIAEFFSDASYNAYIKNAVLTLCGYDTFSIIRRFCNSYVDTDPSNEKSEMLLRQLQQQERQLEESRAKVTETEEILQQLQAKCAAAEDEKKDWETRFKKSGGLSQQKRERLNEELRRQDRIKSESTKIIRDYVEEMMPFIIAYDKSQEIEVQLPREERMREYQAYTQNLSTDTLRGMIAGANIVSQEQAQQLSQYLSTVIAKNMCPEDDPEQFAFIHDLSGEQKDRVLSVLTKIREFNAQTILDAIYAKKTASENYERTSRALRESLPEIDANDFVEHFGELSEQLMQYDASITATQKKLQVLNEQVTLLEKSVEAVRTQIQAEAKNKTAYMYTERIGAMMDELISDAVQSKFKEIEQLTLKMFHEITHKENFIDLLELDESFNISIYKTQQYTVAELYALMENVGTDALQERLGAAGVQHLLRWFNVTSTRTLKKKAKKFLTTGETDVRAGQQLTLYKRVELSQLSKGEKQVFLLSLYWAIIKSSGQQIPFIIDTPFARIDTEHRAQLTKLFFPTVSNQVIILSTDEEVVGAYYDMVRPEVSHEYLLLNEETAGRTVVRAGYFPQEASRDF